MSDCPVLLRGTTVIGPIVPTRTYIFAYFYHQDLVLFTMVPRNNTLTEQGELKVSCHIVLVACSGEKMVSGRRVLVEAKSQRFGSSLWREDGVRESWVGGSEYWRPNASL